MRKQTIIKIFAIILCVALLLTCLVACKPKEIPKTPEEIAAEARDAARNELGEALGNSIDAKLQDGFNLDLSGKLDFQDVNNAWAYGFKIQGNVLAAPKESGKANNDFTIEITKGEDVIFGLYNKGTDMYVSIDTPEKELKFNFSNAPLFESLRYVLAQNLGDSFTGLPSLGNIAVEGSTIGQLVKDFVPLLISQMDTFDSIAKEGNKITVDLDLHKLMDLIIPLIGDLGADFEIALPETAIVGLTVVIEDKAIADINAEVYLSDVNNTTTVNFAMESGNKGFFGAVNNEYAIDEAVSKKFKDVPQTSLVQTEINGTIDLKSKGEVIKTLDWSFKAKLDVAMMMAFNFDLSNEFFAKNNNFFHFQITHTCNANCSDYCDNNVANSVWEGTRNSYKNGKILDIVYGPQSMGSSNITIDLSLFDLIDKNALAPIIGSIAGDSLGGGGDIAKLVIQSITGHFTASLDVNALLLTENIKGSNISESTPVAGVADLDLGGIIDVLTKVLGTVTIDGGVSLDLNGLGAVVGDLLGMGELLPGVGISDILGVVFGQGIDELSLAVPEGKVGLEWGKQSLDSYDAYQEFSKDISGINETKFVDANGQNPYGGQIQGMPMLYMDSAELNKDGSLKLYEEITVWGQKIKTPLAKAPTSYDFEHKYNMGKLLFLNCTYTKFDMTQETGYTSLACISGLDLTKGGLQDVKIGTGFFNGKDFGYVFDQSILKMVITLGLDKLIPINTAVLEGKIEINPSQTISDVTVSPKSGTNVKATDDLQGLKATASYKVDGVAYSMEINGDIADLNRDVNGQLVAGEYTVNYNVLGAKNVAVKITVEGAKTVVYAPGELNKTVEFGSKVNDIDYGTVTYTYADNSTKVLSVKDLINNKFASATATNGVTDGVFTRTDTVTVTVNVNNDEKSFTVTVKDKQPIEKSTYTVTFVMNGAYQTKGEFDKNSKPTVEKSAPTASELGLNDDGSQVLDGWYTDKECTVKATGAITSDMILYSQVKEMKLVTWEARFANGTTYTHTEWLESGKTPTAYPTTGVDGGIKVTAMGTQWIAGWSAANDNNVSNVLGTAITDNKTYYAVIKETPSIVFKTGLMNDSTTIISNVDYGAGSVAAVPKDGGNGAYELLINSDITDRYTNIQDGASMFMGWYTDPTHATAFDGNANVTETGFILYAKYSIPTDASVSYEYTGNYENANISDIIIKLQHKSVVIFSGNLALEDGKYSIVAGDVSYDITMTLKSDSVYAGQAIDSETGAITWGLSDKNVFGLEFIIAFDGGENIAVAIVAPKTAFEYIYTGKVANANITQGKITLVLNDEVVVSGMAITVKDGKMLLNYSGKENVVSFAVGTAFAEAKIDNATGAITWGTDSQNVKGIELKMTVGYNDGTLDIPLTVSFVADKTVILNHGFSAALLDLTAYPGNINMMIENQVVINGFQQVQKRTVDGKALLQVMCNYNTPSGVQAYKTISFEVVDTTYAGATVDNTTGKFTLGTNAVTQAKGIELRVTVYCGIDNAPIVFAQTITLV